MKSLYCRDYYDFQPHEYKEYSVQYSFNKRVAVNPCHAWPLQQELCFYFILNSYSTSNLWLRCIKPGPDPYLECGRLQNWKYSLPINIKSWRAFSVQYNDSWVLFRPSVALGLPGSWLSHRELRVKGRAL